MDYLWDNGLSRVVIDDGKSSGEILSADKVIVCHDGSLFRKSDLDVGKLCVAYGKIPGIADMTRPHRLIGLVRFVFVRFGRLDHADSWVPDQSLHYEADEHSTL
jgi:hypothetical protein